MNKPIVGITMGDPAGSGPEITIKALADPEQYSYCRPIVVGDVKVMEQAKKFVGREDIVIQMQHVDGAGGEQGIRHLLAAVDDDVLAATQPSSA